MSQPRGRGRGRGYPFRGPPQDGQGGQSDVRGRGRADGGRSGRGRGDRGGSARGRGGFGDVQIFTHGSHDIAQRDVHVMRIENESETAARLARTKSTQKKFQSSASLPQRPGFGTQGREVMLWTNYFELVSNGGLLLHRYNIEVLPDQAGRRPTGKKVKRIIELLLEEYLAQHGYNIATDFKSTIISRIELDVDQDGYSLRYRAEHEDDPAPNARLYQIRLQATGTLTVSELIDYLTSTQAGSLFGSKDEIIQALNIVRALTHYFFIIVRIRNL
ncbi:hypothetical protein B0J12DRAFT_94799 [Macrophomina phaseolina]|uniref:Protein argonaute N-terminal domain-containing protein n=1 Tax=Macrophomina phaseolina TaxID=35725 RepID=A0ABQ8FPY4_9PEZI|nr:hypothetical protein B0J12DRAFT_94799 [Macrophomina phaseolina]